MVIRDLITGERFQFDYQLDYVYEFVRDETDEDGHITHSVVKRIMFKAGERWCVVENPVLENCNLYAEVKSVEIAIK